MADSRAFVYVVCGAASHIRTLHRSLEYLRPRTASPIIVVTDGRRNEVAIEHDAVVDVETPREFDHHQASIFLKTRLHRLLPDDHQYVYLDADVVAIHDGVDAIFDHAHGPVTFAHDLTRLENRVATFSPWAVHCACPEDRGVACGHLADAIDEKFDVRVPSDWMHWNGGVFLFGPGSAAFMDTWHRLTLEIFDDPYWKTRDQGTLIATVWKLGLQDQRCLPPQFDFIVDDNNPDLCFDRTTGYSLHESIPGIHPSFLHLYHADLDRPGWNLAGDVEDALEVRTRVRANHAWLAVPPVPPVPPGPSARDTAPDVRLHGAVSSVTGSDYEVIVGVPRWSDDEHSEHAETLVRGVRARGMDAHVLLTEQDIAHVKDASPLRPRAAGVPFAELPADRDASWGTRWGTLVRYLEDRAPCIYVPVGDWRHSHVSPHLSNRVGIVGVVPGDDPRDLDQVDRLGRYWNAVACPTAAIAALVAERHPALADRIVVTGAGDSSAEDRVGAYAELFDQMVGPHPARVFHRPKGLLRKPPYSVAGKEVLPILYFRGVAGVGVFPSYHEDYDDYRQAVGKSYAKALPEWRPEVAQVYPVIIAAPAHEDRVADRFVRSLALGLKKVDHPGHVLVASGARSALASRRFGEGVPVCDLRAGAALWRPSRRALLKHLKRHAPCLYLPGGENLYSDILPRLSKEIGVIARLDDLGPQALERVRTTSCYWNAVVAGSAAIAAGLLKIDPALSPRVVTIPLAIDVPDRLAERPLLWDAPLKVVLGTGAVLVDFEAALAAAGVLAEVITAEDESPATFEGRDVFVVLGDAEAHRAQLQQAMGRGCLPLLASRGGTITDLVRDHETGYQCGHADMTAVVARLGALQKNPALCRGMAIRAFRAVADDMVVRYMMLFERVLREIEFAPTTEKGRRGIHR